MTTVPRRRTSPASRRIGAAVATLLAVVAPLPLGGPASAAPAQAPADCADVAFTARSTADLLKLSVLDIDLLGLDLPALADVRLATAAGTVDSDGEPHKSSATATYADAKLLGLQLPGLPAQGAVASQHAPREVGDTAAEVVGPHEVTLGSLNANGLLGVTLGKSTAEAHWEDAYRCGKTGPLTRSSTTLADVAVLNGEGPLPAIQAVTKATGAAKQTSLARLGPTIAAQTATDVVPLGGERVGVAAAAGAALTDLSLFDGTAQEISIKVVTQPKLIAIAGGTARDSVVSYQPAVLEVTAAGKPVANLEAAGTSVSLNLFGRLAPGETTVRKGNSLLTVRLSLGGLEQQITDRQVSAEAASLRLEVMVGRSHLLDVAIGHLSVNASAPVMRVPPVEPPTEEPGSGQGGGTLPVTGANAAVVAGAGVGLLAVGVGVFLLARRRRVHLTVE
ncbi:LPXTG cell wall anchor domain-containing protein [Phytohabitans kaempferiae]|uniref:LPXTG cell wall anchor domain-containing protein n=1 Tax=Phytohabitans kaempferiae TaxID=1620943 RepID=A0ABV6MC45_9ACTN